MASRWLLCQRSIRTVGLFGRQAKSLRTYSNEGPSEGEGKEIAYYPRYAELSFGNVLPMTKEDKDALERRFAHDFTGTEEAETLIWKKYSYYAVLPFIAVLFLYIYSTAEHETRAKFKPYDHLRIYRKPLPWRDGKKSLLFNKEVNATREGYID